MKPSIKVIIIFFSIFLSGCATLETHYAQAIYSRQNYTFILTEGDEAYSIVNILCLPPSQQIFMSNYQIVIDHKEIFKVFKHSEVELKLKPGGHSIVFSSIPDDLKPLYGESFGRPSTLLIFIKENEHKKYSYTGPYWMWSEGTIDELSQ
jgi:hypothetical protein